MIRIAIDAGHGSNTAGKRTPDNYLEHWINVKTAYACEQYLQKHGIYCLRVGWGDIDPYDDPDISLTDRQKQIKNAKCDYSISCHANASGDGKTYNSAAGVDTFYHATASKRGDSEKLAKAVQNRLIEGTKQKNRGIKGQVLAMCNCAVMGTKASVLIEIGFMTNFEEAQLMKADSFCKEQGEQAAQGILDYLGINQKTEEIKTSNEFKVKCLTDLNIRESPNGKVSIINGAKKGSIYTIVNVNNQWGLLKAYRKNSDGWICLNDKYVQRV